MGDVLEFDRRPSMFWTSVRTVLRHRGKKFPEGPFRPRLPDRRANLRLERAVPKHVAAYRKVCSVTEPEDVLPPLYPFVLAGPLHMALAGGRGFPYPPLGLVHLRQTVVQTRPIAIDEPLTVQAWFGDERPAKRGVEMDIVTHVHCGHELTWSAIATALVRDPAKRRKPDEPRKPPAESRGLESKSFEVPADMGRRYARVCGDYNPIHLRPWTSRRFGFERPIVHGMWSLSRGISEMAGERKPMRHAIKIEARFVAPVPMPSTVRMFEFSDETGEGFSWRDESGQRMQVECTIRRGVREHLR